MKLICFMTIILVSYHSYGQETNKNTQNITSSDLSSTQEQIDSLPPFLIFAEQIPMFPDTTCFQSSNYREQKTCTDQALLKFIYSNINSPDTLREMGIEATVIVSFIVNTDGSLSHFQIIRSNDPPIFAQEFIRVIKLTVEKNGPWTPAQHAGKTIPFQMKLPCRLTLR